MKLCFYFEYSAKMLAIVCQYADCSLLFTLCLPKSSFLKYSLFWSILAQVYVTKNCLKYENHLLLIFVLNELGIVRKNIALCTL